MTLSEIIKTKIILQTKIQESQSRQSRLYQLWQQTKAHTMALTEQHNKFDRLLAEQTKVTICKTRKTKTITAAEATEAAIAKVKAAISHLPESVQKTIIANLQKGERS